MTVKLGSTLANIQRERDGDWVDIPDWPGVALKVRGFSYGPYLAARDIVQTRWARKYAGATAPPEVQYEENAKLYAAHILVDWRGFDEPFTAERALDILTDPAAYRWHQHIRDAGLKLADTEVEFIEDAGKNSQPRSAGSSKVEKPSAA